LEKAAFKHKFIMREMMGDSGIFLQQKTQNDPKKKSWEVRRMLAVNPASMIFSRILSCFSLCKKNSSITDALPKFRKRLLYPRTLHFQPGVLQAKQKSETIFCL